MIARKPRYTGVIPPVVTPLTDDGDIDVGSLERLVAFLIDGGVSGLFALGSSGEVAYLTDAQRRQVLDVIIGAAAGQVPVVAGAIDTTTKRVVERARAAQEQGADAVVATAPFYVRTDDDETDRHFREIAGAIDIPLIAYDVPVAVGRKLDTARVLALAESGVLAGIKDSSGDDVGLRRLALGAAGLPDFAVLTGHEVVVDGAMMSGVDGAVPGLANVDPHGYHALLKAGGAQDWARAKQEQDRLADLFGIVDVARRGTASASAAGLGAFKTALVLRGIIAGNAMCSPMRALDESESRSIAAILQRTGVL